MQQVSYRKKNCIYDTNFGQVSDGTDKISLTFLGGPMQKKKFEALTIGGPDLIM